MLGNGPNTKCIYTYKGYANFLPLHTFAQYYLLISTKILIKHTFTNPIDDRVDSNLEFQTYRRQFNS